MKAEPVTGGIVAMLQFIALVSIGLAFVGGALAGLGLGAEVILMVSVTITASLIWAAAAVIQELRNIAFNTHRVADTEAPVTPIPVDRSAEPSSALNVGGMR